MSKLKIFLSFCLSVGFLSCQEEESLPVCIPYSLPSGLDIYTFPLRPGMPDWDEKTGAEKYEVTQIPDSILQDISTGGLMETWLSYPLLSTILAFNTLQQGIDNLVWNFNGLQEFGRRPNAGTFMLNRYRQMNLHCLNELVTDDEIGEFTLIFDFYEAIFSQEVFLEKLSVADRDILLDLALRNYAVKKDQYFEVHGILGLQTSAIIAARLMKLASYVPFTEAIDQDEYLRVFVNQIQLQGGVATLEAIINYARDFTEQR